MTVTIINTLLLSFIEAKRSVKQLLTISFNLAWILDKNQSIQNEFVDYLLWHRTNVHYFSNHKWMCCTLAICTVCNPTLTVTAAYC